MKRTSFCICLALCLLALLTEGCDSKGRRALKGREVLRVAMDPSYPPFEYVDNTGRVVGLDVDIAQEIGAELGVNIHFVTIGYDGLYDALTVGKADLIISALYPDLWRSHAFVFSPPYFNAGEVLVTRPDTGIQETSDLAGQRVAVIFGTEGHMEALRWEKLLQPPPTILTLDAPDVALEKLTAGEVDAAVVDNITAQVTLTQDPSLRVLSPPVSDEIYVIAGRQEDEALIEEISKILIQMQEDGTMDELIMRWMQ